MELKIEIARYILDGKPVMQIPELAGLAIKKGMESKYFHQLENCTDFSNPLILEIYFKKGLEEFQIYLPNEKQAAIDIISCYAKNMIAGKISIIEGFFKIKYEALEKIDIAKYSGNVAWDRLNLNEIYYKYLQYEVIYEKNQWYRYDRYAREVAEYEFLLIEMLKDWLRRNSK